MDQIPYVGFDLWEGGTDPSGVTGASLKLITFEALGAGMQGCSRRKSVNDSFLFKDKCENSVALHSRGMRPTYAGRWTRNLTS